MNWGKMGDVGLYHTGPYWSLMKWSKMGDVGLGHTGVLMKWNKMGDAHVLVHLSAKGKFLNLYV
jgi:hypothetical protein